MVSQGKSKRLEAPWRLPHQEVLESMTVSPAQGLTVREARERLKQLGANRLREAERRSAWSILAEQFKSLIVIILAAAAALSYIFGEYVDGSAILAVIVLNAIIGFITELRGVRSMEELREMGSMQAKVRRNGDILTIPAEEIVPGDIVVIEGGDVVTADLRLIEASKLQANESTLTGESAPASKRVDTLEGESPLAERANMLYKGTSLTRGAGEGVVVATGMDTEIGRISSLVEEAEEEATPLEKRIDRLGHNLVRIVLAIIVIVTVVGVLRGKQLWLMFETGVALAVAAIPEGLPIVATIALARGMLRMARRNALINKLSSVETLGSTNVIFTDKTGTLTENQMTVTRIDIPGEDFRITGEGLETQGEFRKEGDSISPDQNQVLYELLKIGVLCNNASLKEDEETAVGDPVEVALLVSGAKAGITRDGLLEKMPEDREVAFDPEVKMMATFHQVNDDFQVAVKGAPEAILPICSHYQAGDQRKTLHEDDRGAWQDHTTRLAEEGLRVLAMATKSVSSAEDDPYRELTFLGLTGMVDPPRVEVRQALESCKRAGIEVIMVTGDQPITARKVAQSVGLINDNRQTEVLHGRDLKTPDSLSRKERQCILDTPIFARVSPKQKLDLIGIHQAGNNIVAMTGDGVNDAPALKKADIGVAMGQRGTQVAKEAADMVLTDDLFATIIAAVQQGRVIFNNIRKFVLYLISCNVSEVMVVFLATLANTPLPIRPLQILYLNLVTDVFPALALGVGEGDPSIMEHPPRDPQEPIIVRRHWAEMSAFSFLITVSVLAALLLARAWLGFNETRAITISFLTLALAQLWHVFNMREAGSDFITNDVAQNPFIWGALGITIALLLIAVYFPPLANVLEVANPGLNGWGLVLALSFIPLVVGQVLKSGFPNLFVDRAG
jgi:Ca2+-transporting ATPase